MLKLVKNVLVLFATLVVPFVAQAALPGPNPVTQNLVDNIFSFFWPFVVGGAIALIIGIGFVFLTSRGKAEKAVEGSQAIIFGIIGVAVILLAFSIFTIVGTMLGT